jgi:demethylspheroidene O-methyltransferase
MMRLPSARVQPNARTARSLADLWFRFRNRVLSDPGFQRWAARFPLTRLIARRRATALFDLCAGFVYSQVLYACVKLGVFEALAADPLTVAELAPRLSLSQDATRRVLDAATSLRLVERRGSDRYGLGIHGASLLGNSAVAAMIEHHTLLYRDLVDPVALLRGGARDTELARFWSYAGRGATTSNEADVADYSDLMAGSLSLLAQDILEAYPVAEHRCLLDVAGGEGAFLEAAAAYAPHLKLVLFDLPPVAERARQRFARAGLSSRASAVGGDMLRDPLPAGADLAALVRVVHDHDDPQALEILRSVRHALAPGGVLILAEPMARTHGAEPSGEAYFGFYLLAMGQGRPRTIEELCALAAKAGFEHVRTVATRRPMLCRLLVARSDRASLHD